MDLHVCLWYIEGARSTPLIRLCVKWLRYNVCVCMSVCVCVYCVVLYTTFLLLTGKSMVFHGCFFQSPFNTLQAYYFKLETRLRLFYYLAAWPRAWFIQRFVRTNSQQERMCLKNDRISRNYPALFTDKPGTKFSTRVWKSITTTTSIYVLLL